MNSFNRLQLCIVYGGFKIKFKKIFLFLLITIFLISIGVVSATEEVSNDTSSNVQTTAYTAEQESTSNAIEKNTFIQKDNSLKAGEQQVYSVDNYQELCEKIDESNTNQYTSTITLAGSDTDYVINNNNTINIRTNITINGENITISRDYNDENEYSIFNISAGNTLTINNLILSNNMGSAIINNGTLTINNCTLINNTATRGGAIYNVNKASLTITDSTLSNNSAMYGGAIYNEYAITITNSTLKDNKADLGNSNLGGAIYNLGNATLVNNTFMNNNGSHAAAVYNSGNISIFNSTFDSNRGQMGAGLYNHGNTTIYNVTFINNYADSYGGAIRSLSDMNITLGTFINNTAYGGGGAIDIWKANVNITNSTFTNNSATYPNAINGHGGAIQNVGDSSKYVIIVNSTFTNNSANYGGALDNGEPGNMIVNNSIFELNKALLRGGAVCYNRGTLNLTNTTMTDNIAANGGVVYNINTLNIINSTMDNNRATAGGVVFSLGNASIINSSFSNNNATYGGVICTDQYSISLQTSTIELINSTFNNNNATYGGVIYSFQTKVNIINNTLNNNSAMYGGALYQDSNTNITLQDSTFKDNYVTSSTGYVVDFENVNNVTIINNNFENNTDNVRDMLFSNTTGAYVDINGNTFIDNLLENTIIEPDVPVVTDNENKSYNYAVNVALREIYNDTVRDGRLNVYVNGILVNSTNVSNGYASVSFGNSDLTQRENNITLEYISQSKYYQNTTTSFTVKKEVNTNLTIQAPSNMIAGDTAQINFTLKDVNNNPLKDEIIHVFVDEQQVATVTTDDNGLASYDYTARGDDLVRIEASHHTNNDSMYLSSHDVSAEINVTRLAPEILIMPGTIVPGVESNITIKMFDYNGNPITNKTLTINITEEGKPDITGTVTTDENGEAIFTFIPVDEGTFWVNASFLGDDIYRPESEKVEVDKYLIVTNVEVIASNTWINKTNSIRVEVSANDGARLSGTVELDIDGDKHTVNINNGIGIYNNYQSTTAGNKTLTATFNSTTPGYGHSITTTNFTVEKLPTRVTIEVINNKAGNVTLKVEVFPEDNINSIVDGGNIVIETVQGEDKNVIYTGTLSNGELIYKTDIQETGWHEFAVTYHGNDYFYGEVNNTDSIEILLVNTITQTYNKNAKIGDTITLNATVTDENGNQLNNGNITFYIDGSQIYHADGTPVEAKVENGTATTEYTLPTTYTKGKYTITASYSGNDKYNTSTGESELSIETRDTTMGVTPLNNTRGNTTIELTLNNTEDNKPIPGAEIIITDENGTRIGDGITDENGTAIITVDLPVGDNNITITYPGNDTYSPQEKTIPINVTPRESETTGTITNNTVGNVTIDVLVVDPETGEPVTGPVNIIIDGEVVGNGTLNDEGMATIPVDIDKKGNYTIIVEYEGNDDYKASNDTLDDVYIKGKDVNMTIAVENQTVGNTTVNVTLTDPETGEPIVNATVIVTLPNGTNVTGTTDENGTAVITVDLPSGDNNITITYPGDDEHEAQVQNITVKVKSYSVVTVDPVVGVVLDNVTFTANVRDYQDNPVTGGYVQFNVGGKTLKDENDNNIRVFVENGIAKLSYQAESAWIVDSHPNLKVQAVYTGTSIVLVNRSDTSKVTIYKRNATVEVSAPDDYVNGTLHIDAVVRDQNSSLINDGVMVFKLNGLSVKDENNKGIVAQVVNGKVHIDVKLPFAYSAKKYNLTAVYSNKIYNKVNVTNTTNLKAIPTYVNATVTIKDQFSKPVVTGQIYNKFNNAILEGTAVINIKFDGISYAKKVKINNGTFTETLEGISIYKPGTHKVEVVAGANSHYDAVRKTITTKATPKYNVNTEFINITRNKTTTRVQAKIVDDKNKNVQRDLKITIKLNGKSFLVNQTVRNGKVDVLVDTSTLKNRNYTLELVSGANTYYNAGKTTTELPKY